MTGTRDTTPAARRKPLARAAYLEAFDRAAAALPWADERALDRLRRDAGGKAEDAINILHANNAEAESILFNTIQAAPLALDNAAWRSELAARAAKYRAAAAALNGVLELNRDPAISIPAYSTRALTALKQFLLETALKWDKMPSKAGISQKPTPEIITLRQLRDRLFRDRAAPHEPLRLLAECALGIDIPAATVIAALRSPRRGGNSGGAKNRKTTNRQSH